MLTKAKNTIVPVMACLLLSFVLLAQGCILLIVPLIAAYSDDGITVTVEVRRSAPDVFEAGKKRVEKGVTETGITYKVKEIDEKNYSISIEGTDGSWRANFIVVPISARVSQIIGTGTDDNREKTESEDLVLQGMKGLCDDLGVKYDVITKHINGEGAK